MNVETEIDTCRRNIAEDRQRIKLLEIELGIAKTTLKYLCAQVSGMALRIDGLVDS
jgi:hypothetical protein